MVSLSSDVLVFSADNVTLKQSTVDLEGLGARGTATLDVDGVVIRVQRSTHPFITYH
jgi:hypothetical protein